MTRERKTKTARVGLTEWAAIVAIGLLVVPMACSPRSGSPISDDPITQAVADKLNQLGIAMGQYRLAHGRFPSAATHGQDGQPLLSWRVELLPFLGQKELYDQFHHDEPWDSEHNRPLVEKMPEAYYGPHVGDLDGKTVFLVPTGNETMFFDDQAATPEQITDGLDKTIAIVEVDAEHAVPWTRPADFPVDKRRLTAGLGRGRGGVLTVAGADGFGWTLPGDIDTKTLWSLFTRAGGEKIDRPWYLSKTGRAMVADSDVDGNNVGQPKAVAYKFEMAKQPSPPSIPEQVAQKLHRVALSLVNEKDLHGQFPPAAICDPSGKPLLSWRVKMLRYLDEGDLYDQFHLDESWDSDHNLPLVKKMPDVYLDPHVGDLAGKTVFLLPTGKETIFFDGKGTAAKEITDGLSRTIMVVESDAQHAVPWTRPGDLSVDRAGPAEGLERWPEHFFMMALADAQIMLLPDDIEPATLWSLFTRAGNERVAWPPRAPGETAR